MRAALDVGFIWFESTDWKGWVGHRMIRVGLVWAQASRGAAHLEEWETLCGRGSFEGRPPRKVADTLRGGPVECQSCFQTGAPEGAAA